jgi:multiple sugar transport system permease protein
LYWEQTIKSLKARNTLIAWTFILPNFLGFALFSMIPIIASFVLAFMEWDAFSPPRFIGLANFVRMIGDDNVHIAISNTIYYTLGTVPLTLVASLGLAILLNNTTKGIGFFRTTIFFPFITSVVAVAYVWNMMLHPTMGPVNSFLRSIGISNPPGWTATTTWAMPAIIMTSVWRFMGYYMVIYLAGLQSIPRTLYEAAEIDGANAWRRLTNITLPMLRPTTFFVIIMLTINCFRIFDLVQVMTQGGPGRATTVLVHQLYHAAFVRFSFGYASSIALVLFFIIISVTVVQFFIGKRYENQ